MATYQNITATIDLGNIEADTPQEAAKLAYEAILAQLALPNRISVWDVGISATGGASWTATLWTFDADPEQIVPPALEPAVAAKSDAPSDAPSDYMSDSPV